MRQKLFAFLASVFVLVLMASLASALTLSGPTSVSFTKQGTTFTVTGDTSFDITTASTTSTLTFTDQNSKTAVFNVSPPTTTTGITSALFNISSTSAESGLLIREYTGTINVTAENSSNSSDTDVASIPVTFTNSFCKNGPINDTSLDLKIDISNRGEGDDDAWKPLDDIEIDVELENNGQTDLDNVIFELGLFKSGSTSNSAGDMIWFSKDDEKVEVGDINDDKSKSHLFEFRVDPGEVDDSNYVLVVKAYPKGDETETCIDYSDDLTDFGSSEFFSDMSIELENDQDKMVVVDTSSYPAVIEAFCGADVIFTPDIYNIGDDNFDDQIKVTLFNKELGINLEDVIPGDFDAGDKATASFSFKVPEDVMEKTYTLQMETFYDYDKDDETYDESSDDVFNAYLAVSGNCLSSVDGTGKAVVAASVESGGAAGQDLVVRVTVTNTGTSTVTYIVNPAAYTEWASSAVVSPTTLTLTGGNSGSALVTLAVKPEVSGVKTFNLEVVSGNELVSQQPVSVTVQAKQGGFFTGFAIGGNSAYLWGLGILNVILIIAIIFVVVRILRK